MTCTVRSWIITSSLTNSSRYKGDPPLFELCVSTQRYYKHHNLSTKVLPASFTSINEVMLLAGVDHITVAPKLLRELASAEVDTSNSSNLPSLFDEVEIGTDQIPPRLSYADDEDAFRMAMTRDANGANAVKLIQVRREQSVYSFPRGEDPQLMREVFRLSTYSVTCSWNWRR